MDAKQHLTAPDEGPTEPLTDEETLILTRAIEGGAFDDIFEWAHSDDEDSEEADLLYQQKIGDVATGLLGREMLIDTDETPGQKAFWAAVWRRRIFLLTGHPM